MWLEVRSATPKSREDRVVVDPGGALRGIERLMGPAAFATWEEARLMEEPMTTPRGTADAEALGVHPAQDRRAAGAS